MGLQYAVITSVDRDDLADGGAFIFAETIRLTRERVPGCRIEVLIPDFQGIESSLRAVLDAAPDVLNHNIETVPRLYRMARSGGRYPRSLELLDRSRTYRPDIATKTGIMVGMGEEHDEILAVFDDLRTVGVSILTIGQYLRPSPKHARMVRYYHPDEFAALKRRRSIADSCTSSPDRSCDRRTTHTNRPTHSKPTAVRKREATSALKRDFLGELDLSSAR